MLILNFPQTFKDLIKSLNNPKFVMLVRLKEGEDFNRRRTKWQWAKRKAHRVSSKRKSRVDINLYGFQFLILLKC